jgi:glucose-1-phosphate cytidylyltransferase
MLNGTPALSFSKTLQNTNLGSLNMNNIRSQNEEIPVVVLCGGKGTRLREQTEFIPKPLVEIGGRPILWHIMKIYSHYGFKKFILCLGYKGSLIKEYFMNFEYLSNDFTINLSSKEQKIFCDNAKLEDWEITFVDTGLNTQTGGRLLKVRDHIHTPYFCMTYGDGVSDVNVNNIINHHLSMRKVATLVGINPASQFGIVEIENGLANTFKEKPQLDGMINGGFFVFDKRIFDYIKGDIILEQQPLKELVRDRELAVYPHKGFWACMDTQKDVNNLNDLINKNQSPWTVWENEKQY